MKRLAEGQTAPRWLEEICSFHPFIPSFFTPPPPNLRHSLLCGTERISAAPVRSGHQPYIILHTVPHLIESFLPVFESECLCFLKRELISRNECQFLESRQDKADH